MSRVFFREELEGVATFWRVERRDGVALGFTSHDRDLWLDGVLHRSAPGMLPSAVRRTADLAPDSVEVEGALFSLGDTHAAQGDGEVCGTAIESAMNVVVEVQLLKNRILKFPIIDNPTPRGRHIDGKGYLVTTGIGPDLMQNAVDALDQMVDLISDRLKIEPVDAYMLCSACADLKITEIVDQPNWIVGCHFPKAVLP